MGNCLKPSKEQAPPTSPKPLNIPPIPELENENLRVFSSKEVKKLTKKFGHNRLVVDNNGFGRLFYQGYVNETTFSPSKNGTGLAVSVMHCVLHSSEELEEWKAEIRCLGKISHPNLVKLLGYCCEVKESLLVLECFHKGSLEAHIFGKEEETLPWEIRLKIAIETAQCLAFLHSVNNRALSREFGMHDIFLDEHYNAKLFYLGSNELRLFEDSISTAFIGRTDYTPPEYVISDHLGMKSDVYTFGVILIELLTGLKAFRRGVRDIKSAISAEPFLSDKNKILSIIDPRLGNDYPVNAVIQMGKLIKRCIKLDTKKRPTMQQVFAGLSFPEEVLEHVFSFIHLDNDRNSVSLVCKSWYEIERWCRRRVFIGNCYAVSPATVIRRFPKVRSVELKGKPHFADFNLVPEGWGGYVYPWIEAMSKAYTWLEEIRLKRMVVSDECLELIAKSFKNFKVLVLSSCDGFSTDGLAAIASTCRNLKELDLRESDVDDVSGHWLSHFPDTYTSLVSLNISCLASDVCFSALERLVSRCPNLKSLKLNRAVPLEKLASLLRRAPQLEELGTGGYTADVRSDLFNDLYVALSGCKKLKCLSGLWDAAPAYLPAVYSVCGRLTTLNLSYATVQSYDLVKLITLCPKLQRLWVLDYIEDAGLEVLASTCKDLRELRVFPSEPFVMEPNVALTEQGLVSVSAGCPKLESVLYFCRQMTNDALVTIARNRPNMTRFRLCIIEPKAPDHLTLEPLDVGFGAIVEHCKDLRRLSLSGLLTDKVFEYIGKYAKKMEMLSVAFAGDSDLGMHHVLSGCDSLRKLEIRDCPFGDKALLASASKLETMRSLWMSSCSVSFGACKLLGQKMPKLNVEVIDERGPPDSRPESCPVERVFIYRTVAGPRFDMPDFVWNMDQQSSMSV